MTTGAGDQGSEVPAPRSRKRAPVIPRLNINGEPAGGWGPWRSGVRYQVRFPGEQSKRVFYGADHAKAFAKAQAAFDVHMAGNSPLSELDVASLVAEWLRAHEPITDTTGRYVGWKPSTYETNATYCRNHLLPALGSRKLRSLSVGVFDEFLRSKIGTVAESTRDHMRSVLCQIFEWAVGRDYVQKNYPKYTQKITVVAYEATILDADQSRHLIEVAWAHPLGGVVILAIVTGMREGEILGLQWSKVRDGQILIDSTLVQVRGKGLVLSPTTKTSRPREQPVVDLIARVLDARRRAQAAERLACAPWRWKDSDYVFTTSVGTPLYKTNFIVRVWAPMLAVAGLPRMHFHDLRHSQASLLRELGFDLKDAGAMLGHTVLKTTSGYTQVSPERKLAIARTVEQVLTGGGDAPGS